MVWGNMAVTLKHSEKIGSILFLTLSAVVYYFSGTFPNAPTETGPGSYPRVIAILIAAFALIQFGRSVYVGETTVHRIRAPVVKRVGLITTLILAYVLLMPYLGFLLGTAIFLAIAIRYSGGENILQLTAISITVPIVLHYAFGVFLRVRLPENVLIPISRLLPPLPLMAGVMF